MVRGCGSTAVLERPECTAHGYRRFGCRRGGKPFNEGSGGNRLEQDHRGLIGRYCESVPKRADPLQTTDL
jgi:hypothetical protein